MPLSLHSCHHEPSVWSKSLNVPEPQFPTAKIHAFANALHHCLKLGRQALSRTECSKQSPPRFPQAGAARRFAEADGRQAPIQPSPPQPVSTYFFSPSKSKNDSKAGGAFILARRSHSQTPTRSRLPPTEPRSVTTSGLLSLSLSQSE